MTRVINGKSEWSSGNIDVRHEAALRLFGALSGVDEDYLAACEEDAGAVVPYSGATAPGRKHRGSSSRVTGFAWRYGKAMAAMACAAVLGLSYMSFRLGVFSGGIQKEADFGAAADSAMQSVITAEEPAACEALDEQAEAEAELPAYVALADEEMSLEAAEDDMPAELPKRDSNANSSDEAAAGAMDSGAVNDLQGAIQSSRKENMVDGADTGAVSAESAQEKLTLVEAEKLAVVGAYLPTAWPADGQLASVYGSGETGAETVTLVWMYDNAAESFWVTVSNLGATLPGDVKAMREEDVTVSQNPVFEAEDFTRDCVAAMLRPASEDGADLPEGNFRVLYRTQDGNYVLVGFSGRGSVDEIWRMMRSIDYYSRYEDWQKPPAP